MEHPGKHGVFPWLDSLPFNRFHALAVTLSGLVLVAAGFDLQIVAYAMPVLTREWHLSPVQAGTMVSYGLLGLMAGAVGFGIVADRIGRKKALLTAVAAFSLICGLASLARTYAGFCVLRFFTGVGIGGAFPLTVALLAEFSPSKVRARLVTASVSGFTLGWAVAASVSMFIVPRYGWRPLFQLGLSPLLLLPFLAFLMPESVRFFAGKGRIAEALREVRKVEKIVRVRPASWSAGDLAAPPPKPGPGLAHLFRGGLASMTVLVWLVYLLNTMALYGLSSWLPALLVKQGFSLVKSYGYTMVQAAGSAGGGFLLGYFMDRFSRKAGLVLTYLAGGLSVVFFGSVTSNGYLFLAGALMGVFVLGTPTALNVVCSEIYPTAIRSTGVASTQAMGRIGSILGPILGGLLQGSGVGFHTLFFLFALPCFACMVLVRLFPINVRGEALEEVSEKLGSPATLRAGGTGAESRAAPLDRRL